MRNNHTLSHASSPTISEKVSIFTFLDSHDYSTISHVWDTCSLLINRALFPTLFPSFAATKSLLKSLKRKLQNKVLGWNIWATFKTTWASKHHPWTSLKLTIPREPFKSTSHELPQLVRIWNYHIFMQGRKHHHFTWNKLPLCSLFSTDH